MKKLLFFPLIICIISCSSSGADLNAVDQSKPYLKITMTFNPESYPRIGKKMYPQIALWIQEKGTGYLKTIYVTEKGGKNKWISAKERPDAMPVWYGIIDEEKKITNTAIDGVTGATPSGETYTVLWQVPENLKGKRIELYLEANVSFDYNGFYKKELPENASGYSGVNGQPSVIWTAAMDLSGIDKDYVPRIIGHGHIMGKDHSIDKDMSHVTTAKELFRYLSFGYNAGKQK